jgi:hypothetical protein
MKDLRTLSPVVLIAAVCIGIAGCGSSESAPAAGTAAYSSASAAAEAQQAGDTADAVDACALVSKEEVATLIGATVDGVANGSGGRSACVWENPDTYESVTVDIGAPDTALDNTLPPLGEPGMPELESTPGPDGTRIFAGAVEFAAGNRYNSVQVATPVTMSSDQSIAAAVELIGKIKPKIPG